MEKEKEQLSVYSIYIYILPYPYLAFGFVFAAGFNVSFAKYMENFALCFLGNILR